ncbi:MAG: transporter substrate-binding domain-containing protein [Streptosporangiales bacterium]|nr:transporter substrate-binding domain-containing protein [Streptosporangiales bacterium]
MTRRGMEIARNTRMARTCVAAVVLALAAAGVAGCGGDGTPQEGGKRDVVRVGVIPTGGIAPLHLGIKKGFFEKRGIEVKTQLAEGGAAIVPGVVNGDLHVGYGATVSSAIARGKGLPVKIIAGGTLGGRTAEESINKVVVLGSSEIRSPQDLEGKTVAVNTLGSVAELLIKAVLEKSGVDISKVRFVEIPLPEMLPSLESGNADAVWATEPFLSQAEDQGHRALFSMDAEFAPYTNLASYFTSEQFIAENPDLVGRFIEAANESLSYAREHPDEARDVMGSYLETPEKAIQSMTLPLWDPDLQVDTIELQARYAAKYGLMDRQPATSELIYEHAG